jgi:hypothetical protein
MSALDQAVTKDGDTWTFQCPGVAGNPCGPFRSSEWPTKKSATARGQQHFDEHKLGADLIAARLAATEAGEDFDGEAFITAHEHDRMQELHDFREDQGLVVNDDGSVSVKDL